MQKLITAFATDDGLSFIDRHFGDANFYDIYEISEREVKLLKRIENSTDDDTDEEGHGNSVKAQSVTSLLKKEGVTVAVSRVFGPNLKRIKKKFLCVINKEGNIEERLKKLKDNFSVLLEEWSKKEERNFIRL
jgi:predicted Fe-Mo cluster-binding NifX family protein